MSEDLIQAALPALAADQSAVNDPSARVDTTPRCGVASNRDGTKKVRYSQQKSAENMAANLNARREASAKKKSIERNRGRTPAHAYLCEHCGGWHVGSLNLNDPRAEAFE